MNQSLMKTIEENIKYSIDPKFAYAVAMIESSGRGFRDDGSLTRRFERHVFFRYNPQGNSLAGSNDQQYQAAMIMDSHNAMMSTSYGLYQIMGFNHALVGYKTVEDMIYAFETMLGNHVIAFSEFVKATKLLDTIRFKDFAGFAKKYNGPMYARNGYHTKLAKEYGKL